MFIILSVSLDALCKGKDHIDRQEWENFVMQTWKNLFSWVESKEVRKNLISVQREKSAGFLLHFFPQFFQFFFVDAIPLILKEWHLPEIASRVW